MRFFRIMEKHQQNIKLYLANGGNPGIAQRHALPTLSNRAKISYLLSQLDIVSDSTPLPKVSTPAPILSTPVQQEPSQKRFLGLISQYPIELHPTYKKAYEIWFELCGLKIQLNAVADEDQAAAYDIQNKIAKHFRELDRCKEVLNHYDENKAIMPTESAKDYSKLTPLELDQKRRNLASNICRRKQTIATKEKELPPEDSPLYARRLDALNRKKEELEQKILDEEKLIKMLGRL